MTELDSSSFNVLVNLIGLQQLNQDDQIVSTSNHNSTTLSMISPMELARKYLHVRSEALHHLLGQRNQHLESILLLHLICAIRQEKTRL